jgi:hypothetical protein
VTTILPTYELHCCADIYHNHANSNVISVTRVPRRSVRPRTTLRILGTQLSPRARFFTINRRACIKYLAGRGADHDTITAKPRALGGFCKRDEGSRRELHQLQPAQARVPVLTDDDGITHPDAEWGANLDDLPRHLDIGRGRCRIAG